MNEINYRSAPQSPISVQTLRGSTIVVGDVHGDLNQLMFPLLQFLKNTDKYKKLIFLGDYIDRGESNLYVYGVIKFIMSLDEYKNRIFFLRGNHECYATAVYDMFALGGAYRSRSNNDIKLLFKNAYEEDKNLALKCLFYLRDIREGQGERNFFRQSFNWLSKTYPEDAKKLNHPIFHIQIYIELIF